MAVHQTIEYDRNLPAKIRLRDGPVDKCRGKPHWHEEIQLIYVDSGNLAVTAGNREHKLSAGKAFVINPNEVHSLKGDARYLSIHFSKLLVRAVFNANEGCAFGLEEEKQEWRELIVLLQRLLAVEQNSFDVYSALAKYSVLMKMLRLLLTRCRKENEFSVYGSGRTFESDALAVKSFIEANYRRKILISEVAAQTNHSAKGFTPYFKELTGKCFTDYMQEVRMRHALDDYLMHDISVSDAAVRNGFGHYNFFTKACNKYYGLSPSQIKKERLHRGENQSAPLEKSA